MHQLGESHHPIDRTVWCASEPRSPAKSTTIGMLTTTIAPTNGTACLAGVDVVAEPIAARAASSVVFQDSVVDRGLPVGATSRSMPGSGESTDRPRSCASTRSSTPSVSVMSSTGPSRATAAGSDVASRLRVRSCRSRGCSSMNRPSASIRASASSCST